jgi:SnoaL-like polyketide cyclase
LHDCRTTGVTLDPARPTAGAPSRASLDLTPRMDDLVAHGDRFALRYHWTAPHGDGEIGNQALEINRVENGKIVETWNYQDRLSLMVRLGVLDDPFAPQT